MIPPDVTTWLAVAAVSLALVGGAGLVVRSGAERRVGCGLCWTALVVGLWTAVAGLVPPAVPVLVVAFLVAATALTRAGHASATAAFGYGVWPTVGALAAAAVVTPFASLPLPDIGVLGTYTYLATEVAFGSVALVLLVRAGRSALRSAAVTTAVLYPVAYVWDWYTLAVGVFSIPLRTGHEFAGIPVEEHLFMIVVPAFVLALHETLRSLELEDA